MKPVKPGSRGAKARALKLAAKQIRHLEESVKMQRYAGERMEELRAELALLKAPRHSGGGLLVQGYGEAYRIQIQVENLRSCYRIDRAIGESFYDARDTSYLLARVEMIGRDALRELLLAEGVLMPSRGSPPPVGPGAARAHARRGG